jgi:predicted phage terminase large subunit-like protein
LIGNKLHDDSLLMKIRGKIMGNEMEGVYREYPLIDSNGNCLWPEKYPDEVSILIEKKKVANEIAWQREFLLKIISKEDQIIKREWIQYYDEQDIKSIRAKEFGIGLDLAISMSENADYTAIVTGYIGHRNGKAYIFIVPNIVNKRLTSLETIDKIIEIERKLKEESIYTSKLLFLESNGYQKSIAEHLDIETSLKIETNHSTNSKDERLGSVAFLIESGTVLFPKTGAEQLINQVLGFGSERHDDLVDAMTILLKGLNPKLKRYAQFARLEYEEENWNTFNSREKQMILDRRGTHRPRPDAM